ncbi:MAG: hypothetical protein A3G91_00640 [Omnitrophica WOR_2 bacterium RIFCSPLOWO2_12_FULL_50_9]|nr:MAG: hypothetical protein A3D87_04555 [Omnitrophica WOR_2 bacterium RIFCSPHIGHO2_02_FULL_50_17]OGX42805.1 MAG: hypothetical protein A3G91_00640 [Omnitrophica WOR_2 bacterium RIFCSPLOWO2_12_FULL_50_9]
MIKPRLKSLFSGKEFKEILVRNKVKRIALFGSQVAENVHYPHDYDFLVEFQQGADLFDHVGLKQDLEEYLEKKVDVVTKNSLSKYLRNMVLKEAEYLDV